MAKWKSTISLKDLLGEEEDSDTVRRLAGEVSKRLCAWLELNSEYDDSLGDIAMEFEGLSDDPKANVRYFNDIMSQLYDWADDNRIWIG